MSDVTDFTAFKQRREHPYDCAVNMDEELYAHSDGRVWRITDWIDARGEPCAKDQAVFAIAGGPDPEVGPWFSIRLADFGIAPLDHGRG